MKSALIHSLVAPKNNDNVNTNSHDLPVESKGFSLLELLAVIAIVAIISGITILSLSGINTSQQMNQAINKTEGALNRARAYAIANQTYTWVGFFEKDPANTSLPAADGKGELLISIVASTNGSSIYRKPANSSTPALDQDPNALEMISPLLAISNVDMVTISETELLRDEVAPSEYQVGHEDFLFRPIYFGSTSKTKNRITFDYPLGSNSGPQVRFTRALEFAPNGDATKIGSPQTRLIELGLRPTQGNQDIPGTGNVAVIQIKGITGSIKTLRP